MSSCILRISSHPIALGIVLAFGVVASFAQAATPVINQDLKLTASDSAESDHFGNAVAIYGNRAIVGAVFDDDNGENSGSAYVYDLLTGTELFKFTASDGAAFDDFGGSVSIYGDRAIVGAWADDDDNMGQDSGSAYVYDLLTGDELYKLTASDGAAYDYFGGSVAISADRVIASASGDDSATGSVYVYDLGTGNELYKLTASDGAPLDNFGNSVAIYGDRAIVGAWGDDDNGDISGSAYVYDLLTGAELYKLTASDGAAYGNFGYSVSISGSLAIVGAHGDESNTGSAYVYDLVTGAELYKLTADDGSIFDYFGYSVSISGDRAIVGAIFGDYKGSSTGSAYIFDLLTGTEVYKLNASDGQISDGFGYSVSLSGEWAVVGASFDAYSSGSAYVYAVPEVTPIGLLSVAAVLGWLVSLVRFRLAKAG